MQFWRDAQGRCAEHHAKLMIVSKNQPTSKILPLLEQKHNLFGENRVQEALSKWICLKSEFPDTDLHLIGALQTNKVKQAVSLFDCIQTLDRPKLAHAIMNECHVQQRFIPLMIQINTGEESQKSGVMPCDINDFMNLCKNELKLPIVGVMTLPPAIKDPTPCFKYLKDVAKQYQLPEISMGMSDDFGIALQQGSTMVRLGRKIFEN